MLRRFPMALVALSLLGAVLSSFGLYADGYFFGTPCMRHRQKCCRLFC